MRRVLQVAVPRKPISISLNQGLARPFITLAESSIRSVSKSSDVDQRRHGSSMNVILLENVSNRGEILISQIHCN